MRTHKQPRLHTMWRALLTVAVLTILITIGTTMYDRSANRQALITYPPPGQFVQVGASRMHYLCQGGGEPTLVLEASFGGGAIDWLPIMPQLAQHHRVCAFDRLGQDWSDAAPHPRTFATAADELHVALEQLDIRAPVVVGHSLGGALVQIYAAKYPVRGVVLVDGLTLDVAEPVVARLGTYQTLTPLTRLGLLRPFGALMVDRAYVAPVRAQMMTLRSRSTALVRIADEGAVAATTAVEALRAAEAALDMPLLLLAAEQSDVPQLPQGAFAGAIKALAERKPGSTYGLIPGGTHYLQAQQPQQVVMAITQWLHTIER